MKTKSIFTQSIHAGEGPDPATGALDPPIYQSTTFAFADAEDAAAVFRGDKPGYVYTRWGNPTVHRLEEKIATLEGAESALCTSSGMAAISQALLSSLRSGDHVVCARSVYSATYHLLSAQLTDLGIETKFVESRDAGSFEKAFRKNTRLLYLETPSNPLLDVLDISALSALAHSRGALVFVDNTFATPFNTRPLALGADVVLHSATKYFAGHGDAMGGVVLSKADFVTKLREGVHRDFGGVLSPFNAWLILRGMKTFALRMERHNRTALALARFLYGHGAADKVYYPGLPGHGGHDIAVRQMNGFGGMVSFNLRGGEEAGRMFLNRVRLCTQAVSLGDTRTLVTHPASTTHVVVPRSERLAMGIPDGLIRMSVGLEDESDLMEDLDLAMAG